MSAAFRQFKLQMEREIFVDNFAGGGGASTGLELGLGVPVDVAINHDREAVAMHTANHPHALHYCEDVWTVDPVAVAAGRPVGLAWFSPDCKHFSKAKGGKPVSKKIRGLAWVVVKWAALVRPRIVVVENVEEFKTWGPCKRGPDGELYPDATKSGLTFRRWKRELERLGYAVEMRELRACDYGAPTIRKRLFIIARCDGQPIAWPKPTHGQGLKPYRTAADCIDWSIPCPSIFDRKKPLAEATLRRIARGLQRYVIDAAEPFIVPVTHHGDDRVHGINEPFRTVTAAKRGEFALLTPYVMVNTTGHPGGGADEPAHTVTTGGHHALIAPTLIQTGYGERTGQAPRTPGLDKPLGTAVAGGVKHALVAAFLAQHNTGVVGHKAAKPLSTITSRGTQQAIVTSHLVKLKGTCKDGQPVTEPMPTVQAEGTHIGEVRAFLIKYFGTDQDPRLSEPMHTVTSKHRFGLVTVHGVDYQIVDIGMRMLTPRELYRAQGFPESYIIDPMVNGKPLTKTAQVRMCGNSVCPALAEAISRANYFTTEQEAAA